MSLNWFRGGFSYTKIVSANQDFCERKMNPARLIKGTLTQDFYLYFFEHFFSFGVLIRSRNSFFHKNSNSWRKINFEIAF